MHESETEYVSEYQKWTEKQEREDEKAAFRDPAGRGDPINKIAMDDHEDKNYLEGLSPQAWFYAHCGGGEDFLLQKWMRKHNGDDTSI